MKFWYSSSRWSSWHLLQCFRGIDFKLRFFRLNFEDPALPTTSRCLGSIVFKFSRGNARLDSGETESRRQSERRRFSQNAVNVGVIIVEKSLLLLMRQFVGKRSRTNVIRDFLSRLRVGKFFCLVEITLIFIGSKTWVQIGILINSINHSSYKIWMEAHIWQTRKGYAIHSPVWSRTRDWLVWVGGRTTKECRLESCCNKSLGD